MSLIVIKKKRRIIYVNLAFWWRIHRREFNEMPFQTLFFKIDDKRQIDKIKHSKWFANKYFQLNFLTNYCTQSNTFEHIRTWRCPWL
jgi:hypothetical protein